MTYQVNILNPKAKKLLKDLEDLNLISISEHSDNGFLKVVRKLRKKAGDRALSFAEITKEVEATRAKRYAAKKR
jgi:hypothetical protein